MGKICDPPPFIGGQSTGIAYLVEFKVFQTLYNYPPFITVQGNGDLGAGGVCTGKVTSVQLRQYPNNSLLVIHSGGQSIYFFDGHNGNTGNHLSLAYCRFVRRDGQLDIGGDPSGANCRCTDDSCRVDCAGAPDGFCCIDHAVTNRLLQLIKT